MPKLKYLSNGREKEPNRKFKQNEYSYGFVNGE